MGNRNPASCEEALLSDHVRRRAPLVIVDVGGQVETPIVRSSSGLLAVPSQAQAAR